MAIQEPGCNDGPNDSLRKILIGINELNGAGGVSESVNISSIAGTAASVNCGVADDGTIRVAQATDCIVSTLVTNGAAAAAVNIQDGGNSITVDGAMSVSSITPGTAATSLGKAEDAPHTSGDVGVMALGVRSDSLTPLAVPAGDYIPPVFDNQGSLRIAGIPITHAQSNDTPITTATDTTLIAAPAAGSRLRIRYIHASNSSATTTDVMWRDGAAGTRKYRTTLPQNGIFAHNIKVDYWDLTEATALVMTTSAAGSVHWTVEYSVVLI